MTLTWSSHDHILGALTAAGLRGVYTVEQIGPEWVLHGVGHDRLPMLPLPPVGRRFTNLSAARDFAGRVDCVKTVEAQASGV